MTGVIIEQAPADWEILQQRNGAAEVNLSGSYSVPQAALNVGVDHAVPMVRVVRESDNFQIIPWTPAEYVLTDTTAQTDRTIQTGTTVHTYSTVHTNRSRFTGYWHIVLTVPAGGLYRIETGLDSASTDGTYIWMFRGDIRFHIGVGNLFVIAGQSNAAGFGQDWANDEPELGVHVYRNNDTWSLAAHPLNESTDADDGNANTEVRVSGTSPFLSFGRSFLKLSGCPVGLIPAAKGGSPIELWNREGDGSLYRNMLRKIRACGGRTAGILWYQGCADTHGSSPLVYREKYRRLIANTREDLGYCVPFFTFQLNRELFSSNDEGWGMIREIQRTVPSDTPEVYVLPTLTCSLTDEVHNNSSSNVLSGERLAKLCGHVLCHTPKFEAPDIMSADIRSAEHQYGVIGNTDIENTVIRNVDISGKHLLVLTFSNAEYGFILNRKTAGDCGFTASDREGAVELGSIACSAEHPEQLIIELLHAPKGELLVSFCSEENPSFTPPTAAITYLPPLAFYRFPADVRRHSQM